MNEKGIVAVTVLIAVSLLLVLSTDGHAEACLYNPDTISPDRYLKNGTFKSVKWNANTKIVYIRTKLNEPLVIKHWACTHFGIEAELKVLRLKKRNDQEEQHLTEKVRWLSSVVLDKVDQKKLAENLQSNSYKTQISRMIDSASSEVILFVVGDQYAQITVHLKTEADKVVINLHAELD